MIRRSSFSGCLTFVKNVRLQGIYDESRLATKDRRAVKAIQKSTIVLPVVPEQGTVEQIMTNGMAGGRPQGEDVIVEEKEWVQVNRKKKSKGKRGME